VLVQLKASDSSKSQDFYLILTSLFLLLDKKYCSFCPRIENILTFAAVLYYNHLSRKAEGNGPLKP
jgi:hypothetical protein